MDFFSFITNAQNVGLNADWSCSAYHFGPSPTPNTTAGDVYVLDNEDDDRTYSVVRRWYSVEPANHASLLAWPEGITHDGLEQVGPDYATLDEATHAARTLANSLSKPTTNGG